MKKWHLTISYGTDPSDVAYSDPHIVLLEGDIFADDPGPVACWKTVIYEFTTLKAAEQALAHLERYGEGFDWEAEIEEVELDDVEPTPSGELLN